MSWWDEIQEKINSGDVLYTPGRGLQRIGKKPFRIISKDLFKLIITSGASKIPLEKQCFDKIEEAFSGNPLLWLRVASLHDREALENSVDKLIREANGSQLARGNYICAILEYCELVLYSMSGNRKGIKLIHVDEKNNLPKSGTNQSLSESKKIEKVKLLKIWEIIHWLDRARWNPHEAKKVIIPGPIFENLTNSQKILVHWILYITDQQRPYADVWIKGGPIFAEIISNYRQKVRPSLELLKDFSSPNNGGAVDVFSSKRQLIGGKTIRYTPRYGMHILSIARTLYLLESFERDIIKFLHDNWDFINSARNEFRGDNHVSRIAFLLYILSYADITRGIVSFHKDERKLKSNLKNYGDRVRKLLSDKNDLTFEFKKWSKGKKYHKRLWAALRDYLKPGSPFCKYFKGAIEDRGFKDLKNFLAHNQSNILRSLEIPGDIWNLRFLDKIFRGLIISPVELRERYEDLKDSNLVRDRFYPEQFDVSFSFSQYMCDELMEEYCPFKANSRIREYCLVSLGITSGKKLCPVAMITCGFEYYCQTENCPIKEGLSEDLCSGCSVKVAIR